MVEELALFKVSRELAAGPMTCGRANGKVYPHWSVKLRHQIHKLLKGPLPQNETRRSYEEVQCFQISPEDFSPVSIPRTNFTSGRIAAYEGPNDFYECRFASHVADDVTFYDPFEGQFLS